METWWAGISAINKVFVCSAVVFTLLFVWQIIMTLVGADTHSPGHFGDSDVYGDLNAPIHYEAHEYNVEGFTIISVRSVLAFATIFSWSGTLYLSEGTPIILALLYSFLWGAAAMIAVALVLHLLLRMQEQGNVSAAWAIGEEGSVYISIPADGIGKIRIMVRGVISVINARGKNGAAIEAGTRVKVVNIINQNTVEVIQLWNLEVQ